MSTYLLGSPSDAGRGGKGGEELEFGDVNIIVQDLIGHGEPRLCASVFEALPLHLVHHVGGAIALFVPVADVPGCTPLDIL